MPIYRYRCSDGHEFESLEPMGTDSLKCPRLVLRTPDDSPEACDAEAKKIPQTSMGLPVGGPTPTFYPGRKR
jgi:predicted nucleic acid-binding Zn ribbon protein